MNDQNKILEEYERQVREAQLNADQTRLGQQQQEMLLQDNDKGMISEQLDLGELLDKIHNLLRGYVLKKGTDGNYRWSKPESNDLVILSDYGVNYIMGAVQWYLNKNTLLSNYDDEQIMSKMEDLSMTMVDDVFMEYDKMFLYPTLDDCKDELKRRIRSKVDIKKFALEVLGKEVNEKEIENKVLSDMEERIERELETIKEQKIKNKLKRFESLMRFVQDTIHSAYQRAWKGQERTTLRQHIHISETKGGNPVVQQQQGINPFSSLRRK